MGGHGRPREVQLGVEDGSGPGRLRRGGRTGEQGGGREGGGGQARQPADGVAVAAGRAVDGMLTVRAEREVLCMNTPLVLGMVVCGPRGFRVIRTRE